MDQHIRSKMNVDGEAIAGGGAPIGGVNFHNIWRFEAFTPRPEFLDLIREIKAKRGQFTPEEISRYFAPKWTEEVKNTVVNTGLDDILDKYYKGSTYTAAHYVGLTDGTPTPAAGDTMASHAGWTEVTAYDEANRPTLTLGSVSSQSVDNSASKAQFTIDTNSTTIGGAFLSTDNTVGGTSGTLIGVAAFTAGDKSLDDNDVLNVTVTLTASAA